MTQIDTKDNINKRLLWLFSMDDEELVEKKVNWYGSLQYWFVQHNVPDAVSSLHIFGSLATQLPCGWHEPTSV